MKIDRVKEVLSKLTESEEYRKDFNRLIKEITSRKTGRVLKFATWHWPAEWDGDFKKITHDIPLSRFKKVLRDGNINYLWIQIPGTYFRFRSTYQMHYFFDPSRGYADDFNPFMRGFFVRPCYPPMSEKQHDKIIKGELKRNDTGMATPAQIRALRVLWNRLYNRWDGRNPEYHYPASNLFLEIDITGPLKSTLRAVEKEIKEWRSDLAMETHLVGRPESKYSTLKQIKAIWEKTCKGRGLSKNQQAKLIQENLGYPLNANTINKHYLSKIVTDRMNSSSSSTINRT